MAFLPENYDKIAPSETGGRYTRFVKDGVTRIRPVSSAIVGYEYWTNDNKPHRTTTRPDPYQLPENVRCNDAGQPQIRFFWAFVVWNFDTQQIEVCEITQASVREGIMALINDPDFGDPSNFESGYGLKIARSGQGLDTKYTVTPGKVGPLDPRILDAMDQCPVRLEALFSGEDPFALGKADQTEDQNRMTVENDQATGRFDDDEF